MSSKIRLGTRGSQLALTQSNLIAKALRDSGVDVEVIQIKTSGDQSTQSLAQIGGQGVFTKKIQQALLDQKIDLAVHSLKDLPTVVIEGLKITAVPKREDVRDVIVVKTSLQSTVQSLDDLPANAKVGTGSMRRRAQLLQLRNDLDVLDIRGNVDTRLEKLESGEFDAIVLASAGLRRLGLESRIAFAFSTDQMAPAVGQGALGLEVRSDDERSAEIVSQLNDQHSYSGAMAERSLLRALQAGCMAPVGTTSKISDGQLELTGVISSLDGTQQFVKSSISVIGNAEALGIEVAEMLIKAGAGPLLNTKESGN